MIATLHTTGTCKLATCPNFTLNPDAGGDGWKTEALRYRIEDSFDCPSQAAIATRLQNRFPTPLGLAVYGNFEQLEEIEGKLCVPKPAGRLRGLHCVLGCGLAQIGGISRVKIATKSWGLEFGEQGCRLVRPALAEQHLRGCVGRPQSRFLGELKCCSNSQK